MPGGICASKANYKGRAMDASGRYDVRCCGNRVANVEMRKGPFTFRLAMGGRYVSDLVDASGRAVSAVDRLTSADDVRIDWTDATFIGWHWLLGKFRVELAPHARASGTVQPTDRARSAFFPARNVNAFYFRIHMERFGRILENRDPLINSSLIREIPPVNSLYGLDHPVAFYDSRTQQEWSNITKCWVLIPDQKYIEIDVTRIDRGLHRIDVEAILKNVSPCRFVLAYWFTNVEDPTNESYTPSMGMKLLGRKPRRIRFSMLFEDYPKEPTIQLGAAVITNPIANDPHVNTGGAVAAFDIDTRAEYLRRLQRI